MTNDEVTAKIAGTAPIEAAPAGAEAEPSVHDRAHALVAEFEHAMANNAPVTLPMIRELKALLDVA